MLRPVFISIASTHWALNAAPDAFDIILNINFCYVFRKKYYKLHNYEN